jgi:phosphoadenylyl-sulfate reductase (thioredoxin)
MIQQIGLEPQEIAALAKQYEHQSPQAVLSWALERFGSQLAICTSFQADGMALLDMAWRIDPTVRVFTIDTGRLPQETYALLDQVREKYDMSIEVYFPDATQVESVVRRHGINLFYRDSQLRLLCCQTRKVLPLKRVLATLDAWVTGLRRDQSTTRAAIHKLETDVEHGGLLKINPLASWSKEQVWITSVRMKFSHPISQGYTVLAARRHSTNDSRRRSSRWTLVVGSR